MSSSTRYRVLDLRSRAPAGALLLAWANGTRESEMAICCAAGQTDRLEEQSDTQSDAGSPGAEMRSTSRHICAGRRKSRIDVADEKTCRCFAIGSPIERSGSV